MRWLFLIALFLNIAYVTWQMLLPATDSSVDVPVLKNVEPIVLLAELKQRDKIDSINTAVDQKQKSLVSEAKAEAVSADAVISDQAGSEPQDIVEKQDSVEKSVETKDAAVPVPVHEEPVLTEISPLKSAEGEACFTLGPFHDLDKLRSFMREIKPYVAEADFRGEEENRLSVYWVYLPPEKNRKQARKTGKLLKDKKIKDFYIIREGEKNNGISLGYFRNKNRAFRLKKKVKNLGFDVQVEPIFKTYTVYWLGYQLLSGVDIPEAIIEEYSQPTKTGKISRLSRDCGA